MIKAIVTALFVCALAAGVGATEPSEYNACIEYIYTNYNAKAGENFGLEATDKGLIIGRWELPCAKPALADVIVVRQQALAWKSNQVVEALSDITAMPDQLKSVVRAFLKTINLRLPEGQKITEEEIMTAIKAEARQIAK